MRPDIVTKHRARTVVVAVALGGGLALGVAGLAQAADPAPSGSAAPSAEAGGPGPDRGGPREHRPHLSGTVKSITDSTIMITDRAGFTRQINITAEPDGVTVGTRIHAVGTVNADGVSLDATEVRVAPEGVGKRGGFGHRGGPPGGPWGEGGAPSTVPSTAPSVPAPGASAPGAPAPSAG